MSYKIVFKGNLEDLYVSNLRGSVIALKWKNEELVGKIDIEGTLVEASAIKAIIPNVSDPDQKDRKSKGNEQVAQMNREFSEWRKQRLAMSPKDRAQDTSYMNYMSQCLRGRPLGAEEIPLVREAQERWFIDHLDFHQANPICYFTKEDIARASSKMSTKHESATHISDLFKVHGPSFAERHINAY